MFKAVKKLLGIGKKKELLNKALRQGAYIIDVRTPAEYKAGHIQQAVNIPLDQISQNAEKIKKMGKPVVTCCQTGARSGRASSILKRKGIEAYNGGGWVLLKDAIRQLSN